MSKTTETLAVHPPIHPQIKETIKNQDEFSIVYRNELQADRLTLISDCNCEIDFRDFVWQAFNHYQKWAIIY